MSFLTVLSVFNYGLVLLYGLFLSIFISGGWSSQRQRLLVIAVCPLFLLVQSVCWLALGVDVARQLYPLIVHLPLALILILILKKKSRRGAGERLHGLPLLPAPALDRPDGHGSHPLRSGR